MSELFSVLSFTLCHAEETATFHADVYLLYTVLHLWPYVAATLGCTLSLVAVIHKLTIQKLGVERIHLRLLSSRCHDGKSQLHDANAPPPPPWFVLFQSPVSFSEWITHRLPPAHVPYKVLIPLGFSHSCPCAAEDLWVDSLLCERFSPVSLVKKIMTKISIKVLFFQSTQWSRKPWIINKSPSQWKKIVMW